MSTSSVAAACSQTCMSPSQTQVVMIVTVTGGMITPMCLHSLRRSRASYVQLSTLPGTDWSASGAIADGSSEHVCNLYSTTLLQTQADCTFWQCLQHDLIWHNKKRLKYSVLLPPSILVHTNLAFVQQTGIRPQDASAACAWWIHACTALTM